MSLKKIAIAALTVILLTGCSETLEDKKYSLDKDNPTTITIATLHDDGLEMMVNDFNSTTGADRGINVDYTSVSTIEELIEVNTDMIVADYNTIYSLCTTSEVAELPGYFSEMDLGNMFFESSIEQISLSGLRAIPIRLDLNLLVVNLDAWENFSSNTDLDTSYFNTWDGIREVAETYYNITGECFLSISSGYNIISEMSSQELSPLVQTSRSGASIYLSSDIMQTAWNCIIEPQVKGYITMGGYDTIESGTTIATYCPLSEIPSSSDSNLLIFKAPSINEEVSTYMLDTTAIAINSSNDTTIYTCVQFIKYLTNESCNYEYATSNGCIPANKNSSLEGDSNTININAGNIAVELISNGEVFNVSPFDNIDFLETTLETAFDKSSVRNTVKKRIDGGMREDKIYEDILDLNSFKEWYDGICELLKAKFPTSE